MRYPSRFSEPDTGSSSADSEIERPRALDSTNGPLIDLQLRRLRQREGRTEAGRRAEVVHPRVRRDAVARSLDGPPKQARARLLHHEPPALACGRDHIEVDRIGLAEGRLAPPLGPDGGRCQPAPPGSSMPSAGMGETTCGRWRSDEGRTPRRCRSACALVSGVLQATPARWTGPRSLLSNLREEIVPDDERCD